MLLLIRGDRRSSPRRRSAATDANATGRAWAHSSGLDRRGPGAVAQLRSRLVRRRDPDRARRSCRSSSRLPSRCGRQRGHERGANAGRDAALRLRLEHASRRHAPACAGVRQPIGVAALADHRFIITADGYASVEPALAHTVHGVLWRITPRDRVTLDGWENVAGKLYRAETMPVRQVGGLRPALVYIARPRREGRPKAGYMELVVAAARPGTCRRLISLACSTGCRRRPTAARARGSWRHRDGRDPSRRDPRPGAGRRLSRLDRIHRARARPARLGAQPPRRRGRSIVRRAAGRGRRDDCRLQRRSARVARRRQSISATARPRNSRCAGAANCSRCCRRPDRRSSRRTAARTRRATPCRPPASTPSRRDRRAR